MPQSQENVLERPNDLEECSKAAKSSVSVSLRVNSNNHGERGHSNLTTQTWPSPSRFTRSRRRLLTSWRLGLVKGLIITFAFFCVIWLTKTLWSQDCVSCESHQLLPLEDISSEERTISSNNSSDERATSLSVSDTAEYTAAWPLYVPGFFLLPASYTISDDIWETQNYRSTSNPKSTPMSALDETLHAEESLLNTFADSQLLHATQGRLVDEEAREMKHNAYPMHAGNPVHIEDSIGLKTHLEYCANKLLSKLKGQGLEATKSFEFALHHCKAIVDGALAIIYPSAAQKRNEHEYDQRDVIERDPMIEQNQSTWSSLRTASDFYCKSDIRSHRKSTTEHCDSQWKRPSTFFSKRSCSVRFCDRFADCNFGICYKYNQSSKSTTPCELQYAVDSADDFLSDAPYECNLCFPEVDCVSIDKHCEEVEAKENLVLKSLLIALGTLLLFTTLGMWIRDCHHNRQERKVLASLREKGWLDENHDVTGGRTPVMPTARTSSNSMRRTRSIHRRSIDERAH